MMRFAPVIIAAACALIPFAAAAQFYLSNTGTDITITANPAHPGPNQKVSLTVTSALLNLSSADITWTLNGQTQQEGVGKTQITITTGNAGESTSVEAIILASGQQSNATLVLTPQTVDLLYDAASYAPPFYKGRSLASSATSIRVEAVPHFIGTSGEMAANTLVYTWTQDGNVQGSLSGIGKSTIILGPPPLFGASTISVQVSTADGTSVASNSIVVPAHDPGVTLYLDHPLFGIEYYNAVQSRGSLPDTEATFAAIPYFVAAKSPDSPSLNYVWYVNGSLVASAASSSSEITMNANGITGPTNFSLHLRSSIDPLLSADGAWTMSFGQSGDSFASPLASPAPQTSAFHSQ